MTQHKMASHEAGSWKQVKARRKAAAAASTRTAAAELPCGQLHRLGRRAAHTPCAAQNNRFTKVAWAPYITHGCQPNRPPRRRTQRHRAHHMPRCSSASCLLSCCRWALVAARRPASRSRMRACSSACSSSQAALLCCCACCACRCCCTCCPPPLAAAAWLARQAASRSARNDLQSGSRTTLTKSADSGPSSWLRCQRHSAGVWVSGQVPGQSAVMEARGAWHGGFEPQEPR